MSGHEKEDMLLLKDTAARNKRTLVCTACGSSIIPCVCFFNLIIQVVLLHMEEEKGADHQFCS